MKPAIIVNFKAYENATGGKAVALAKRCAHVALETGADIRIAVQTADIAHVASAVDIPVYAQHVDGVGFGKHTGAVLPEAIKDAGAIGSLINHSEWKIPLANIKAAVERCKKLGLEIVACADTPEEAAELNGLKPTFIAIEPPELIGGDISVSTAKPEVITSTLDAVNVPVLAGAGVKNSKDVRVAIDLGVKGVLVASGVVKATDVEDALKELISGF
jgi:triosephosphate isomerase